jgi:predicted metalloprotease with PDZ domain
MAGTSTRTGFLITILALAIVPGARADDSGPIRYDIRFPMHGDRIDAVEVRATASAGVDGRIDFVAPWQGAAEVRAESGTLDTSAGGHWIVKAKPGDDIVLVWRTRPAQAWRRLDGSLWRSVLVRPDAVAAAGGALLALPDGARDRVAEVHWSAPPGWAVSTTFKQGMQTLGELGDGTFMMALHGAIATRTTNNNNTIRVMTLDPRRVDVERVANDIASVVNKATPPAMQHDFTLNIVDLDGDDQSLSINGRSTGAMVYLLPQVRYDTWAPFVIGAATMPAEDKVAPANAWYTQGFTAFHTLELTRDAGLASPSTLAYLLNQATTQYGNSPLRRAPNRRVVEEYAAIRELRDLPPARGALFAMLLDDRIRKATGGVRSLEDALGRMPAQTDDPGPALIDAVAAVGAGDVTSLYRRYIVDGELLQLPRDALAPCFTIGTVADWGGWQTQHVFARAGCGSGKTVAGYGGGTL